MKIKAAIVGILALFAVTAASAQQFPTVPDRTVIGRIGVGGQSGPSQAIPFANFLPNLVGAQSVNTVFAGPASGGSNVPSFRLLVGADLPNPGASSKGGVQSLTCSASNWFNALSTGGVLGCSRPNFTDLAGSISAAQIPAGTIIDAAVSNSAAIALSKLAAQNNNTIVGNVSGGSAVPIALTQAQLATLLTGQLCAPQRTVLITGSGTYTTPTCNSVQANALEVELQGGGSGGSGSGTIATSPTASTAGNNSTFGALTASGGGAAGIGGSSTAAIGGACSGSLGTQQNFPGADANGYSNNQAISLPGASGGSSYYGGAGAGTFNAAGSAAKTNSGSGGAGGGGNTTATVISAGGGAAGCHITTLITSPAATISYAVGGTAAGGVAGTSGFVGGIGAAGVIIVTARWQ